MRQSNKKLTKRILAFTVILALMMFSGYGTAENEEAGDYRIVGGYTADRDVTPEDLEIFNQAMAGASAGVLYEPVKVATQVVAGLNYRFTVTVTPFVDNREPYTIRITIFKPLNGKPEVTGVEEIWILQCDMHETYAVDGTVLAALNSAFPQLTGSDVETIDRVNAAIRGFIRTQEGYDTACAFALEAYQDMPERFAEIEYGLTASVHAEFLRDNTLLAVRYDFLFDAGGAHPWDTIASQHFDLVAGTLAAPESLMRDPQALRALVAEETLRWADESGFYVFDEVVENIQEWPLEQGLLTSEGLLVFFNEGEIGPVSEGAAEILITYDKLGDIIF